MEKKQEDEEQEDKEQEDKEPDDKEQDDNKASELPPSYIWVTSVDGRGQDDTFILTPPDNKGKQTKIRKGRKKLLEEHHKNQRYLNLNVDHVCGKGDGKSAPSVSSSLEVPVPYPST